MRKLKEFKLKIVKAIHAINEGEKVEIAGEPIRSDEDLMESSKDMFMMVGAMTFFNDEDQFEEIYSSNKNEDLPDLGTLKLMMIKNMVNHIPLPEDVEYRFTANPEVLKWKLLCETKSSDGKAILLGLSRPRTEAVSFHIAGSTREDEKNLCPGIDHAAAYPIEVLLIEQDNEIKVFTTREMFRMDMYFWDAGMMAFMDHMSMPAILDDSIRKALLGDLYED